MYYHYNTSLHMRAADVSFSSTMCHHSALVCMKMNDVMAAIWNSDVNPTRTTTARC